MAAIWIMSIKKTFGLLLFIIVPTFIFFFFKGLLCNSDIYIKFILTQYLNQLNVTNKQIKIFSQKQTRFYFILFLNVSDLTISYSKNIIEVTIHTVCYYGNTKKL